MNDLRATGGRAVLDREARMISPSSPRRAVKRVNRASTITTKLAVTVAGQAPTFLTARSVIA
jgi:hypothetical protein